MKQLPHRLWEYRVPLATYGLAMLLLVGLFVYRLGNLANGLSLPEVAVANQPLGLHDIYTQPLYLPLLVLRSVLFHLSPNHGYIVTRLPNALMGMYSIVAFVLTIRLWLGSRIAFFASPLFATSAWVLHVSRLASSDVVYLAATCSLLLSLAALQRYAGNRKVLFVVTLLYGLMLYIPGAIWLVLFGVYWRRKAMLAGWQRLRAWWQRALLVIAGLIWLPLLIVHLSRPGQLLIWLGYQGNHDLHDLPKQLLAVPIHAFLRGPQYPEVWLGKLPILSVFCLAMCLLGIYFYTRRLRSARSQLIASLSVLMLVLVTIGNAASFSLTVPLLYVVAATGIAYLLHLWLRTFPLNRVARATGLCLLGIIVLASCVYDVRAYFVAWPNNTTTQTIFRYHR